MTGGADRGEWEITVLRRPGRGHEASREVGVSEGDRRMTSSGPGPTPGGHVECFHASRRGLLPVGRQQPARDGRRHQRLLQRRGGIELAQECGNAASLQAAYQSVATNYALYHVDFDLEAVAIADPTSVDRCDQGDRGPPAASPGLVFVRGVVRAGNRIR